MLREITPSKTCWTLNNPSGCIICQKNETNARKHRSIGGKTSQCLLHKLVDVLEVPLELLTSNLHRYICETPCSKDLENHYKYKEKAEELKNSTRERFNSNLDKRTKRGLPSDIERGNSKSRTSLAFLKETVLSQANSAQNQPRTQQKASVIGVQPLLPAPDLEETTLPQAESAQNQPSQQKALVFGVQPLLPVPALPNNHLNANAINLVEAKRIVTQEECQSIQVIL